jgi:hypothetical protein
MSFGGGPYGGEPMGGGGGSLFQIVSATALNPVTVRITFSEGPNLSAPATIDTSSYTFGPNLQALQVIADPSDVNSLRVITTEQDYQLFTVTVSEDVESYDGSTIDPNADEATFTGFPSSNRFAARAQSATAINLVFHQPMLVDSELSDPFNYTLQTIDGSPLPVVAATPNLVANATRVILTVISLTSGIPYVLTISPNVKAADGRVVLPDAALLVWSKTQLRTSVPLSKFTGEVRAKKSAGPDLEEVLALNEALSVVLDPIRFGPAFFDALPETLTLSERLEVSGSGLDTAVRHAIQLSESIQFEEKSAVSKQPDSRSTVEMSLAETLSFLESLTVLPPVQSGIDPGVRDLFGNPNGLVFFSPALKAGGSPSSSIQVDDVKACTQAFERYEFPQPVDPPPLFTHGGGVVPTPVASALNTGVLFAGFYVLGEAKHNLGDKRSEVVVPLVDIGATFTLTQVHLPADVSLLNSTTWALFSNTLPPPYNFTTANNLSPFPPSVVSLTRHFVNPAEVLSLGESLFTSAAANILVGETFGITENFDLVPGENVVQVNVFDSLTLSEAIATKLGVNLFETLTLGESISTL